MLINGYDININILAQYLFINVNVLGLFIPMITF